MTAADLSARDTLMRMTNGFQVSQAIHVAATLGIADLLRDGPKSVDELAGASGTHAAALYRLLRALASVGVFVEADGRFGLTPLGEYLRTDIPGSVGPWAMLIGRPYVWTSWGDLLSSVRSGTPAFPRVHGTNAWHYRKVHPEENIIFNAAMTALSAGVAEAVVSSYTFSRITVLADVGGGEGALLAAILAATPSLRGILFDQPHVVATANAFLERAGVADRGEIVSGSFFDAVPQADGYLLKSIVHDWDDAGALDILKVVRAAITDTGRVLLVERLIRAGNDPDPAKFADLTMLVQLGGRERTADEFGSLYDQAGFSLTNVIPTPSPFSIIEGAPA